MIEMEKLLLFSQAFETSWVFGRFKIIVLYDGPGIQIFDPAYCRNIHRPMSVICCCIQWLNSDLVFLLVLWLGSVVLLMISPGVACGLYLEVGRNELQDPKMLASNLGLWCWVLAENASVLFGIAFLQQGSLATYSMWLAPKSTSTQIS